MCQTASHRTALPQPHRSVQPVRPHPISPRAFVMLLLLACMFGGNHVAARVALDHGVDVTTAVAVRSLATATVVAAIVVLNRVPLALNARQRRFMPLIAVLVGIQSLCLYSAVARIPVGLALLAFNTYPLWTAVAAWTIYGHRPERAVLIAMPVILFGLALALDVSGAASGLGLQAQWLRIGSGVGFALVAGAAFGLVLALTQHEVAELDGRLRTAITMGIVGVLALLGSVHAGRTALARCSRRLVGPGRADAAVRHRLYHHVHAAAQAGRGRQLADPERRAGGGAGHGLAAARAIGVDDPGPWRAAGGGDGHGAGAA